MLRSVILKLIVCLALGAPLAPAATQHNSKKTIQRKKSVTTVKHTASRRTGTKSKSTASAHKKRSTYRRAASPPRQQTPTPQRYTEIQQALADKGYYKGQVNGAWGPESVDALKRFQADKKLVPDGKLGSLSIIALGLGPKRETAALGVPPSGADPARKASPAPAVKQ